MIFTNTKKIDINKGRTENGEELRVEQQRGRAGGGRASGTTQVIEYGH
jgi:hypothetical protein